MNRKEKIAYLTANCDCWKTKPAKAILNEADDDTIDGFHEAATVSNAQQLVVNTLMEELDLDAEEIVANSEDEDSFKETISAALKTAVANMMDGCDDDEDDVPNRMKKAAKKKVRNADSKVRNAANKKKVTEPDDDDDDDDDDNTDVTNEEMDEDEWLSKQPKRIQQVFNDALQVIDKEKVEIVKKLVANISDKSAAKAKSKSLMKKDINDLREMVELIPAPTANKEKDTNQVLSPLFKRFTNSANGVGHRDTVSNTKSKPLPTTTLNFNEDEYEPVGDDDEE